MKREELKQLVKEVIKEAFNKNLAADWYVKEKGDKIQRAPNKKEAAKLLWNWIKSDRDMDFQKFFRLTDRLAAWTGLPMTPTETKPKASGGSNPLWPSDSELRKIGGGLAKGKKEQGW